MAAAERRFQLDTPDTSGHSPREHVEGLIARFEWQAEQGRPGAAERVALLKAQLAESNREDEGETAFPPELEYVFHWFLDLSRRRGSNGFGPNPLSALEVHAWCQLSGHQLTPWEFGIVTDLDQLWLKVWSEVNRREQATKKA